MKVIITDTNVFIDLIKSNALDYFFQLPLKICTTDLVLEEIRKPEQYEKLDQFRQDNRLTVLELDEMEIVEAWNLKTEWVLKRITDRSVLWKAIQLKCMVLSGDNNLKKECQRHGLAVHGTIWVIREIWQLGICATSNLQTILNELGKNTRLPGDEIESLRQEIKNK